MGSGVVGFHGANAPKNVIKECERDQENAIHQSQVTVGEIAKDQQLIQKNAC